MSATIAHSSHVTYTGRDSAGDAVAWLTTTLNFLVPRAEDVTVCSVDVELRSVQELPVRGHSCHRYVTPGGASATAVSVTVPPNDGSTGLAVTVTTMGHHSTVTGADSAAVPEA